MKYLMLIENTRGKREERLFDSLGRAIRVARAEWGNLLDKEKWNDEEHISVWSICDDDIKEDGTIMAYTTCFAEYSAVRGLDYID